MPLVAKLFALLPIAATLLPLLPTRSRWLRSGDFPRLQIAIVLLVAIAGLIVAGPASRAGLILMVLCLICLAIQARFILPYTPLVRVESARARNCPEHRRLRVMIANVLMDNRDDEALLTEVARHDPDLFFAVETDQWWVDRIATLGERMPHVAARPQDNYYGMVLHSKLPLSEVRFRTLVQEGVPSLKVTVRFPDGRPFVFYGVHPPPPPLQDTRQRDAELLIVGRQASNAGLPALVAGDLNDVGWSPTTRLLRRTTMLLDPRIGRGMYATFDANSRLMRWPLDHIFHSPEFALVALHRGRHIGSDHLPIVCDFCLMSAPVAEHDGIHERPGDGDQVSETIHDGLAGDRSPPAFLARRQPSGGIPPLPETAGQG